MMGYAFISYSTKNQSAADAMRTIFLKHDIDTWMAPYDIPVGSEYAEILYDTLSKCACLVLMLTDVSQNSQWVRKEVNIAITSGKTIIPVKLEEIELNSMMKFYLSDQQIVPVHIIDDNSAEIQSILKRVIGLIEKEEESSFAQKFIAESKQRVEVASAGVDNENISKGSSESNILENSCDEQVSANNDYKLSVKNKDISDDEKLEIFKEVVKRPKILISIVLFELLIVFVFCADGWQQYRFETANRAYVMMEKQEYAEAAELMEQYLDISWTPYWKLMELTNGENDKFSRPKVEAALQKCRKMITEEQN